jgi:predicted DCC family thiol-disulfide oxidoreductase YuxK
LSIAAENLLFYDPLCPMCVGSVELLRRRKLLERAEARPLDEAADFGLSAEDCDALRGEMILHSRETGESLRGYDALIRLLELHGRLKALVRVSAIPPLRALGKIAYRLLSMNRRIISPPNNRGVACDCDPPFQLRWRVGFFVLLMGVALVGTFFYGLSLWTYQRDRPAFLLGLEVLGACAAGWSLGMVLFLALLPDRFRSFFWQCLMVLVLGLAVLVPFATLTPLLASIGAPPLVCAVWHVAAIVSSSTVMLLATRRRHRNLGFPRWTPWLWLGCLEVGGVPLFVAWNVLGF